MVNINLDNDIQKNQIKIDNKNKRVAYLSTYIEDLKRQINFDSQKNLVLIKIDGKTFWLSGSLDELTFNDAIKSIMEIDLPNKDKILREGFINCILKEDLESTSDLPISIFRNFKQYMLDTICKEKEKIKEEIKVLSNDMQNLITDTSISLDL